MDKLKKLCHTDAELYDLEAFLQNLQKWRRRKGRGAENIQGDDSSRKFIAGRGSIVRGRGSSGRGGRGAFSKDAGVNTIKQSRKYVEDISQGVVIPRSNPDNTGRTCALVRSHRPTKAAVARVVS